MNRNIKSSRFLEMEDCILSLQTNPSQKTISLTRLSRLLKEEFDMTFNIDVINNAGSFFGMNVTPKNLDAVLVAIIENKSSSAAIYDSWNKIKSWCIEIDSTLLYDKKLGATPSEIIAVLMHEIGHVVYSNKAINRAIKTFKVSLLAFDIKYRTLVTKEPFSRLMLFPLYEALTTIGYSKNRNECIADDFAINMNYGPELESILTKLIKTQGTHNILKSENEKDMDAKIMLKWAIENISSLEYRRDKLRRVLSIQKTMSNSKIIGDIINDIERGVFGNHRDNEFTVDDVAKEQFFKDHMRNVLCEKINHTIVPGNKNMPMNTISFGGKLLSKIPKKKLSKIEMRDIDILEADIEGINYPDDKIFILERLHDMIEDIDKRVELIDNGYEDRVPQTRITLLLMRERLDKMRTSVRNTIVPEKQYGLYVKYPKGYKG